MPHAKSFGALCAALCVGVIIGPLVVSAAASLMPFTSTNSSLQASYRLLDGFVDYRPEPRPLFGYNPDALASDCGYKREEVFSESDNGTFARNWTPFEGYFDLSSRLTAEYYRKVRERRAEQLERGLSGYLLRFLDHCIRETEFAYVCASQVDHVLKAGDLGTAYALPRNQKRPDLRRSFHTICTYLDGLVAQRGGHLSRVDRSGPY